MEIRRKEVYRYLGYHGQIPDDSTQKLTEECIQELLAVSSPKSTYQVFPCQIQLETVFIGPMKIQSKNLCKNLAGCQRAILFAATLGSQADFLLKKYSRFDMAKAVVLQAAAAAVIEEYCDECQREIETRFAPEGMHIRPRFSPGYGDFSLSHQKTLTSLLDCPRQIGLTLTDSLLLAPSKSVTAVMGLSNSNDHCPIQGCETCDKINCQFRRS